jgi:hypothetical protein
MYFQRGNLRFCDFLKRSVKLDNKTLALTNENGLKNFTESAPNHTTNCPESLK